MFRIFPTVVTTRCGVTMPLNEKKWSWPPSVCHGVDCCSPAFSVVFGWSERSVVWMQLELRTLAGVKTEESRLSRPLPIRWQTQPKVPLSHRPYFRLLGIPWTSSSFPSTYSFLSIRAFFFFPFCSIPTLTFIPSTMVHADATSAQATTDLLPIINLGLYLERPDSEEAIAECKRVTLSCHVFFCWPRGKPMTVAQFFEC